MSSPASVAAKIVITIGLISGVSKMALMTSSQKSDLHATETNIQMLKADAKDSQKAKPTAHKVSVSSYQKAEFYGKETAKRMTQVLSASKNGPKSIDYKSPAVRYINKRDASSSHRLVLSIPYLLGQYHVQYTHGGIASDGTIIGGFLFYDAQNQLQGVLKCRYNPYKKTFSHCHMVMTNSMHQANEQAKQQLQAAYDKVQEEKNAKALQDKQAKQAKANAQSQPAKAGDMK